MKIKELEKEIKEKITVLDKDELKKVIKYIDMLCNDDLVEYNDTINHLGEHLSWPNLSQDPMASIDAYQKLCGLIADPGSSLCI